MIFSTKQPVRVALCCAILMVSLSKCEIDSSSSIIITTTTAATTTPANLQLGEEEGTERKTQFTFHNTAAFSIPSSVETSSSYSSSSSSFKDVAATAAAVTFNNANAHWQQQRQEERQQQQQEASGPNNANIINGTITPSAVSPILTSPVLQEAVDSDGEDVEEKQTHQQQQEQSRNFAAAEVAEAQQNQDNIGSNEGQTIGKGETLSSSFGASQPFFNYNNNNNNINTTYYKAMSSGNNEPHFLQKSSSSSFSRSAGNIEAEAKPETTARQDSLGIELRLPSSSSSSSSALRRQQAALLSRIGANGDKFFSSSSAKGKNEGGEPEDDEEDNGIPAHVWIPAGLSFSCKNRVPGYYSDASSISKCQVYHMCMTDGRKYTLLCGIGTVFNQLTFVCDHWYNYKCSDAESDYRINTQLWEEFVGGGNDEAFDEEQDQNNGNNENYSSGEAVIQSDVVHQSMPLRSPFTITRKISKSSRRGSSA